MRWVEMAATRHQLRVCLHKLSRGPGLAATTASRLSVEEKGQRAVSSVLGLDLPSQTTLLTRKGQNLDGLGVR